MCFLGGGTGSASRYRSLKTIHADGSARARADDRMVYINGLDWAVDAASAPLSDTARARIAANGPYTQDFARVFPILQPHNCQSFMDELLADTSSLLVALGPTPTARDFVLALLSRPNVNPGGPTHTTFLTPLLECDTKSYDDMRRIVDWAERHCGGVPLVLNLWGDGQSVLRLRDLKRMFPWEYRHVLVGNGPFHSGALPVCMLLLMGQGIATSLLGGYKQA